MDSSGGGEICETSTKFKNFDVLPNVAKDHHFLKNKRCKASDETTLKIMKEWKSLSKNLPESIYVRAYEQRIDLLRAVIIGSSGTPYHDGLFFFDISLPADYPNQPPVVFYHSHGYRLNPNLYSSGMVCLSLINTWPSKHQSMKWRTESTILQLLVSLQGLVLNERPYFNEPGYGIGKRSGWAVWRNASNAYNEDTFILSCNTMLKISLKPPEGFMDFVRQHFRDRTDSILAAVDAYGQGFVLCGQFQVDGECSSSSSAVYGSAKFKANLKRIRPILAARLDWSSRIPQRTIVTDENGKDDSSSSGTVVKKKTDENGKDGSSSSGKGKREVVKEKTGFWGILSCFTSWKNM